MRREHPKHCAIIVADDCGKSRNRALTLRHTHLLETATSTRLKLDHIVEMPMFVRSEVSEGVQLCDLCAYAVYRAFTYGNLDYPFFTRVVEHIYRSAPDGRLPGLRIYPSRGPLVAARKALERKRQVPLARNLPLK